MIPRKSFASIRLGALALSFGLLAGCGPVVGALRAFSSGTTIHEEEWSTPAWPPEPNDYSPQPGECIALRPNIQWYDDHQPSAAPVPPHDVLDLSATLVTPNGCELTFLDEGHTFEIRGLGEVECQVAIHYVHPVTHRVFDRTFSVPFRPPPVRQPMVLFERPDWAKCSDAKSGG